LGIVSIGADELETLLEGDGEEIAFDFGSQRMKGLEDPMTGLTDMKIA
jgi:hypothetical protein